MRGLCDCDANAECYGCSAPDDRQPGRRQSQPGDGDEHGVECVGSGYGGRIHDQLHLVGHGSRRWRFQRQWDQCGQEHHGHVYGGRRYTLQAVLIDSSGSSANSSVAVTVSQMTKVTVTPATATVATNGTQPFMATAGDQFGNAIASAAFTWAVNGGGLDLLVGVIRGWSVTGGPSR